MAHSIQAQVCHLYREERASKQVEKWSFFLEQIRADRFSQQTGINGGVREMLLAFSKLQLVELAQRFFKLEGQRERCEAP